MLILEKCASLKDNGDSSSLASFNYIFKWNTTISKELIKLPSYSEESRRMDGFGLCFFML